MASVFADGTSIKVWCCAHSVNVPIKDAGRVVLEELECPRADGTECQFHVLKSMKDHRKKVRAA